MHRSTFVSREICLAPGDRLILYTDGLTEARNASGDFYGDDSLRQAILSHRGAGARTLVDHLLKQVNSFSARAPRADDITLLVVDRIGARVS
jgi:sigma-B regulation protein RsbU (phosphoserine phosphatase)